MLKVTIFFDVAKKEKVVYEDVENIYIYPEPKTYINTFPKSFGCITQRQSYPYRIRNFTQIYKKPYMFYIEEQPMRRLEI